MTSIPMDPSFGDHHSEQGFGDSAAVTDIDWGDLQGLTEFPAWPTAQESMSLDLWSDSISSSLSRIQSPCVDDSSSYFSDSLPNSDAQELYLPNPYPSSLLPLDTIPTSGVNSLPSAPLPGAIVPHATSLLASIPGQERPPYAPNTSVQLPDNVSLGLLDGNNNNTVADGERDGGMSQNNPRSKGSSSRKQKADNALVGMNDGSVPKPVEARRLACVHTLPGHLEKGGYSHLRKGSRANKNGT